MNHLNIFNPYKNKANYHEDELTRSFLILFKNIPLVQAAFIEMVREEMLSQKCEWVIPTLFNPSSLVETVETQITEKHELFQLAMGRRLVSIVISDDKLYKQTQVENSDRSARYDGVILYQPSWILVIENKPLVENIWLGQLNPNVSDEIEIEKNPVALSWRSIINALSSLIEKNIVQGLDYVLIDNFLEYVDNEYPQLNPYTQFSICKNNAYLLEKRCNSIMDSAEIGDVAYHRGWKNYISVNYDAVKQIALSPEMSGEAWSIIFEMYPGDTMSQARSLYNKLQRKKLDELMEKGWRFEPNLHFSFRAQNLVWTNVRLGIKDYIAYWVSNIDSLGQIGRTEFEGYFKDMERLGMLSNEDWVNIKNKIITTKMQKINVCPGIHISFSWKQKQAIGLDKGNNFVKILQDKIHEIESLWTPSTTHF